MFNFIKKIGKSIISGVKKIGKKINNTVNKIGKNISNIGMVGKATGKIENFERTLGKIANQAYQPTRASNIDGYIYSTTLSAINHAIYENDKNIIFGIRGTKDFKDINSDLNLLKGNESQDIRFNSDLKFYDELTTRYPNKNVILTGHSLGGSVVIWICKMRPSAVGYAFNPGVSFTTSIPSNVKILRTTGDVISGLSWFKGNTSQIKNVKNDNIFNAHSSKNFI